VIVCPVDVGFTKDCVVKVTQNHVRDSRLGCNVYTISLLTLFVPTCSIWQVNLFLETGVVHRITYSFSYIFLIVVLFIHFILDIKKACCIQFNN
jgi:hypothetical protein